MVYASVPECHPPLTITRNLPILVTLMLVIYKCQNNNYLQVFFLSRLQRYLGLKNCPTYWFRPQIILIIWFLFINLLFIHEYILCTQKVRCKYFDQNKVSFEISKVFYCCCFSLPFFLFVLFCFALIRLFFYLVTGCSVHPLVYRTIIT